MFIEAEPILDDLSKRVKYYSGGNAPVIAQRMAKEGADVILGAQDGTDLPIDASVKPSGPSVPTSDIHLILEYNKDEQFGSFTAPRANRFIVHADRIGYYTFIK